MIAVLLWYGIISIVGLASFPLMYRLLPNLRDRGYAFSRTAGLLLWGYLFWLLTTLGITYNERGGILLALAITVGLSVWIVKSGGFREVVQWSISNKKYILAVEVVFAVAFGAVALLRAGNPEILGTEKPMELAFINAILRSKTFPPHDPWLSGYAISYYYFGYVLVAMLAKLAGTSGGVAFNLGLTLVTSLSAVGAYGILYNLLSKEEVSGDATGDSTPVIPAMLGPLWVLVVSNLGGLLEMLHSSGLFWRQDSGGSWTSAFWRWLNIKDWNVPPSQPFSWVPDRFYWWWRASRVVNDINLVGQPVEVIDEFPFFSILLGDLHPHVLAMPFAFLALAVSFNLYRTRSAQELKIGPFGLSMRIDTLIFGALVLGGLAFLNTWDFPIYVFIFSAAYVLRQAIYSGWRKSQLVAFIGLGLLTGLLGVVLYLPFYFGFSSQAGGFMPNLIFPTRGAHLWIMFATLLIPLFGFLLRYWRRHRVEVNLRTGLALTLGLTLFFWLSSLLMGVLIANLPDLGVLYVENLGADGLSELIAGAFGRRLLASAGWITLVIILTLSISILMGRREYILESDRGDALRPINQIDTPNAHKFLIFLVLVGGLLVLVPEFFFLRDQFNSRMNTVFKFYFQAWLLWGIAAAYASIVLVRDLRGLPGGLWRVSTAGLILVGMLYPVFGILTKTNNLNPPYGWTLDGTAYLATQSPDDKAVGEWLRSASFGVIAEAVGGQYSSYARMATNSGLPNVLGWPGHESQWRGGNQEMGSRETDIRRLYCTPDWNEAQVILEQYSIRYVIVGSLERSSYVQEDDRCPGGLTESKFLRFLQPVFQAGQTTIYEYP